MDDPPIQLPDQERVRLRIFTLADHAAVPPDGKLYIGGAGVHQLGLAVFPGPILAPLFIVVRIQVPYLATGDPHGLRIRILDEDALPIGQNPVLELANAETGRAPGSRPGDEFAMNIVVNLTGYMIDRNVERELRTDVHLDVDGQPMDKLPLKIFRVQQPRNLDAGRG